MLKLFPGDGCGNRFLLVRKMDAHQAGENLQSLAQRLCGGRYDGLLVLGHQDAGAMSVQILNPDGSDGDACLNGLRVAACFTALDRGRLLMAGRIVAWRRCTGGFELNLPDGLADLGVQDFCLPSGREGFAVSFWNPHAVFAFDAVAEDCRLESFDLKSFADSVRKNHELFPNGVNVEMVEGLGTSDTLRMRVSERGVGETAACGSGALAAARAAWFCGAGARIGVGMAGGRLEIERATDGSVHLRGAAGTSPGKSLAELLRGECKLL